MQIVGFIDKTDAPTKKHNFVLPDGQWFLQSTVTEGLGAAKAIWQPNLFKTGGTYTNAVPGLSATQQLPLGSQLGATFGAPSRWQILVTANNAAAGYYMFNV